VQSRDYAKDLQFEVVLEPWEMATDQNLKSLRRTITPYVGQAVIFAGVTAFMVYPSSRTSEWDLMWGPAVIWGAFAVLIYIGMKYRVLWDETGVVMRASGGKRLIRYDEITEIKIERAKAGEFLIQSRPFRRIVIHGRKRDPTEYIDVSLRHFRPADIDELLAVIRSHRPDLTVPIVPWGTGSL
jgi:hypothetical protein